MIIKSSLAYLRRRGLRSTPVKGVLVPVSDMLARRPVEAHAVPERFDPGRVGPTTPRAWPRETARE